MPDTCKCGAELMFMKMASGAAMPYRTDTSEMRLVRYKIGDRVVGKMVQTWVPHWADCEYAEEFKPGAASQD